MSYRPSINYHSGHRTLNYPAVGAASVRRLPHSGVSNLSNANHPRMIQGHRRPQTSGGGLHGAAGKLESSSNFRQGAGALHHGNTTLPHNRGNLEHGRGNLQHTGALNTSGKNRLDPQTSARLRHWNGNVSSTTQAHRNHRNHCQNHHHHHWWHNHCAAIIFWNWGWWGWYDGWWYPAWGYDPYSYYDYNEPIYGYGDLTPEQIIAQVQVALQQRGYYQYEIDGQMGPLTRAAIARYQSDHRLPITSGIDPATLGSLGIVR